MGVQSVMFFFNARSSHCRITCSNNLMGTVEVWTRLDGADGRLTEIYVRQDD